MKTKEELIARLLEIEQELQGLMKQVYSGEMECYKAQTLATIYRGEIESLKIQLYQHKRG